MRPRAYAVLRFTTKSILDSSRAGISAGLAPFRTLCPMSR